MSESFRPHGLQHARPPCPSPTPRVYSNSCPLSWWCHPTISASVIPFSPCLQSFPASGSFPVSQFFTSAYWSFSFSISPSNEHPRLISFRMDWFDLLPVQGILKSSPTPRFKSINSLPLSFLYSELSGPGLLRHLNSLGIEIATILFLPNSSPEVSIKPLPTRCEVLNDILTTFQGFLVIFVCRTGAC